MKLTEKRFLLCLLTFALLLLAGCGRGGEAEVVETRSVRRTQIGISFDTFTIERWLKDRDVFVATAQKLGADVDVQNSNGDVEKQKDQIKDFISSGVDVIVVIPVDCYALADQITRAREAGIRVICYDRMIQGAEADLYITCDNYQIGQEMGKVMVEKLPEGGNIIMFCGPEKDTNSLEVSRGFEDAIKGSRIEVREKVILSSWTAGFDLETMQTALQAYPEIDGIMCGDDEVAGEAIQILSEQQRAGQIVVTGQDADLEACQRIVEGTQSMTVRKPIEEMAKKAAEYAVSLTYREGLSEVTETMKNDVAEIPYYRLAPRLVTRETMDEVVIDSGFHLRDEVYLNVRGPETEEEADPDGD